MLLSAKELLQTARDQTGIAIEDSDAVEPLGVLVDSLNTEAELTEEGAVAMHGHLLRMLKNRLYMERDYQAHPDIEQLEVKEPVFVFGVPRSGTTKLQKVLSAMDDFTGLPFWMARNPSLLSGDRDEPVAPRIAETDAYVEWVDRTSPGVKTTHAFETMEPEEFNVVLEQGFVSGAYLPAFLEVPSFIYWPPSQDAHKRMQYMKRVLKYLQWQFKIDSNHPWILKDPTTMGLESAVKDVFPDSHLIMTHRHPAAIIASSASLCVNFHKLYSDIDVRDKVGPMLIQGQAHLTNSHLENIKNDGRLNIMHIGYREILDNTQNTLDRVYQHAGKRFNDRAIKLLDEWEQAHQQHKYGAHRYTLEEFGLTDAMIDEAFSGYIDAYKAYF
jgi:Sulfotransferase family